METPPQTPHQDRQRGFLFLLYLLFKAHLNDTLGTLEVWVSYTIPSSGGRVCTSVPAALLQLRHGILWEFFFFLSLFSLSCGRDGEMEVGERVDS